MLVSERAGRVRVVENGVLIKKPLLSLTEVSSRAEEGLMSLAVHPQYATNKFVYVAFATVQNQNMSVKVIRFTDQGDQAADLTTVIDNIPAARFHAGTRLRFGPDKKLYISTGDALMKDEAQNLQSLAGKVLRLNDDGTIPSDNPFPNSAIFSYGHRNIQGFDWHPQTEQLYATEHGPSTFDGPPGGDEINLLLAGKNYGWPIVSHEKTQAGFESPLQVYTPAVAPASGVFYAGEQFPQWENSFFFGGLRGEGVFRVQFSEDGRSVELSEKLSSIEVGRVRDIAVSPEGIIYFSSSNKDGRGDIRDGDDAIYRIVPAE
jgi:glucose/arabinose dehydrogenase